MFDWRLDEANVTLFVLVDSNGDEVAGLGSGFTLQLSKNGGGFAGSAGTKAEIGNGWYSYTNTVGEADTEGTVALKVTGAGVVQQNLVANVRDVPADVWSEATRTLTQSATEIASAVDGDTITIHRGDTFIANITGLGDISDRAELWFTLKYKLSDTDDEAWVQIEEGAGLIRLNGEDASARQANGVITVTDDAAGNITITLDETETDDLEARAGIYYDIQVKTSAGNVSTLSAGSARVTRDVTRAVA